MEMKEYDQRYQNPINKVSAALLVTGIVLAFIIVGGLSFTVIKFSGNAEMFATASENMADLGDSMDRKTEAEARTAEILMQVAIILNDEGELGNLTRKVS